MLSHKSQSTTVVQHEVEDSWQKLKNLEETDSKKIKYAKDQRTVWKFNSYEVSASFAPGLIISFVSLRMGVSLENWMHVCVHLCLFIIMLSRDTATQLSIGSILTYHVRQLTDTMLALWDFLQC